jgi:hypothetical protein
VVGAQLSPETEEEGGTGTGDVHKMNPWGYLVYKNTQNINMINFIGSVSSDFTVLFSLLPDGRFLSRINLN